jgi:hypothetical protein
MITKQTKPETEIKYFKFFPGEYPTLNLIFAGDFNCPQSHTVFIPLRKWDTNLFWLAKNIFKTKV